MVDIPGCYSLMAHSTEEEVARDFICFEHPDAVVVVCDATCLERNLNLVLQVLEATPKAVVCVNLMDEAKKKSIDIRLDLLEERLGVPVAGTAARSKKGLDQIYTCLSRCLFEKEDKIEDANVDLMEEGESEEALENPIEETTDKTEESEKPQESKIAEGNEKAEAIAYAEAIENADAIEHVEAIEHAEIFPEEPIQNSKEKEKRPVLIRYPQYIEDAIEALSPVVESASDGKINIRWLCARLLDSNDNLMQAVKKYVSSLAESGEVAECLEKIRSEWRARGIHQEKVSDDMASVFVRKAEYLCRGVVIYENQTYNRKDRKLDFIFTSKSTGFPIMFLVLLGIFWLTITGANYPSQLLSNVLFGFEDLLSKGAAWAGVPELISNLLVHGMYRSLAWVVSVMLPPMAIFFPLFTLLEDFGYLPRVAFNLDRCFKRCSACGKQALTM